MFGTEVWIPLRAPYHSYCYKFAYLQQLEMQDLGLFSRGIKTRKNEQDKDYYGIWDKVDQLINYIDQLLDKYKKNSVNELRDMDDSVLLVCSTRKTSEYKNLDDIIRQNATYKHAMMLANQQLKQLRRKAVIVINDDRYKL